MGFYTLAIHTENVIEIELKLLVPENAGDIIKQQLLPTLEGAIEQSEVELSNDYFDTPERTLRKHDIGFRIRGCNGVLEQTLKTAGKISGGLHQRPEFNIPLDQPVAALSLFDRKVWPKTIDLVLLQARLSVIFSTRFTRQIYLITFADGGVVELVWDTGEVVNNGQRENICEIELELKRGKAELLFTMAKKIVALMPVRLGNASKAARGYALSDGAKETARVLPENIELATNDTIETAFSKALEVGLAHWQHHEALFLVNADAIALHNMYAGIELVFSALTIYQPVLKCERIAELSKKLELWMSQWQWLTNYHAYSLFSSSNNVHCKTLAKSPQLVNLLRERGDACVVSHQPKDILLSSNNVMLQLEIGELLTTMPWRQVSDTYLSSLHCFAKQQSEQNQKVIFDILSRQQSLQSEDYIFHAKTIRNAARLGCLLGAVATIKYRQRCALWRELVVGSNELELWERLKSLIATSNIDDKGSLLVWCSAKMSKLSSVMERSRQENY
ncbi:MAG: triphosphatase [Paraglaciecola sp.]|jgi:triphosphatase